MSKTSQSLAWKSSWHFRDTNCIGFPAKWCLRNEHRDFILITRRYPDPDSASDWSCHVGFASTNQKHYPDLASHASSVWNFCARFSDVISQGNQWCRRKCRLFSQAIQAQKWRISQLNYKISKCHFVKCWKTIKEPSESTAKEVSFGWSHQRILFTDSKVRTTLYSIINSTTGKYCSVTFIWMVTP